jgi:hypothetical protein
MITTYILEECTDEQLEVIQEKLLEKLQQETNPFDEKETALAISYVLSEQAVRAGRDK